MNTSIEAPDNVCLMKDGVSDTPVWKRALDVALCLTAVPVVFPLLLIIALTIRICSPGPVIFKQKRVGHRGTAFFCYKLRTMHLHAESASHERHVKALIESPVPMAKLDSRCDPRLIPCGRWLRASGLDELPQMFNIIKGEMSFVGPRPCLFYEYKLYNTYQRRRFNSVPGLTGLWQVSGKNKTTFQEMVDMDIHYESTKSFFGDVLIIIRTPFVLVVQLLEISHRTKAKCVGRTISVH